MDSSIILEPSPYLRTKTLWVTSDTFFESQKIVKRLFACVQNASGVGLAANQIGNLYSIMVINHPSYKEGFINPIYEPLSISRRVVSVESCLSLPGKRVSVPRHNMIRASWVDTNNFDLKRTHTFVGVYARIFQHEVDHLNGILITDYE